MRYGVTYNANGQLIPPGLHIPQNFALLPYVPHPLQLTGHMTMFPALGQTGPVAGVGATKKAIGKSANSGTGNRPL